MNVKFDKIQRILRIPVVLIITIVLASWPSALPIHAQIDACSVGVSPQSVGPGIDTSFSFGLYNSNEAPINWIEVTRPSGDLVVLEGGGASAWQATVAADTVTFSDGSLPQGYSQGFGVQALTSAVPSSPANWSVRVSDSPDGSSPTTCDGDLSLEIQTQPSLINISNVRASSVGSSNVTILWDTDVASTSQVFYGADHGYGSQSELNTELVTSHSVKLTDLPADSSFHYQITSTTPADGGASTSDDNTFLTAEYVPPAMVSQAPPLPVSATAANVPGVSIQSVPTEHVPPTISFTTDFSKPFKLAPVITGRATDNVAVARVEYSADGGKNWLPVNRVAPTGNGSNATPTDVTFEFTPILPEDGNYRVLARAIDSSSNHATTPVATLIIDRLPPQVGEMVISFGPEILAPDASGQITLVSGSSYRFTTSAIGGATEITVSARRPGAATAAGSFALAQAQDSGLWSGLLSLEKGGMFELTASSVDGAGNHTVQPLGLVAVMPAGKVVGSGGKPVPAAHVTLYYLEPASHTWVIWDGAPYGEANPQVTRQGQYSLMVPPGTYYLESTADGFAKTLTRSLNVTQPTSLTAQITMGRAPGLRLGSLKLSWPAISFTQQALTLNRLHFVPPANTLLGSPLPEFTLPLLSGDERHAAQLNGRPTVVSLLDLWSPSGADQISALAKLQRNTDIGVVPVFTQENAPYVNNYLRIGGYQLTGLADPDGVLVGALGFGAGPKHLFLDRSGHIKKVVSGVLTESELTNELGGM